MPLIHWHGHVFSSGRARCIAWEEQQRVSADMRGPLASAAAFPPIRTSKGLFYQRRGLVAPDLIQVAVVLPRPGDN